MARRRHTKRSAKAGVRKAIRSNHNSASPKNFNKFTRRPTAEEVTGPIAQSPSPRCVNGEHEHSPSGLTLARYTIHHSLESKEDSQRPAPGTNLPDNKNPHFALLSPQRRLSFQFPRPVFSVGPLSSPEHAILGAETDMASFSHGMNESGPELTRGKATRPKYSNGPFGSLQFALCNAETTMKFLPAQAGSNITRHNSNHTRFVESLGDSGIGSHNRVKRNTKNIEITAESFPCALDSFIEPDNPPTPPEELSLEDVKARFKSVLEPIREQSHSLGVGSTLPSALPTLPGFQTATNSNLFDPLTTSPSTSLHPPRYPDFPDVSKSPEISNSPDIPVPQTKVTKKRKRRDKTKRSDPPSASGNPVTSPIANPIGLLYDHLDREILPSEQSLADLCDDSAPEIPDLGCILSDIEIEQAIVDNLGSIQKKRNLGGKSAVRVKSSSLSEGTASVAKPSTRLKQVGSSECAQSASIQSAAAYPNTRFRARALTISKTFVESKLKSEPSTLDELIEDAKLAALKRKD